MQDVTPVTPTCDTPKSVFDQWQRYNAARKGGMGAMVEISLMHHSGLGVTIDLHKAEEWLQKDIDGGSPRAWALKGDLWLEGWEHRSG